MDDSERPNVTFHQETKAFLEKVANLDAGKVLTDLANASIDDMRAAMETAAQLGSKVDFDGKRRELFVPSVDVPGGIPIYVYEPKTVPSNVPILIYFHGGGNFMGSRQSGDAACKLLCSLANCVVLNVEYRLMPEHVFPASVDDAEVVLKWVLSNRKELGGSDRSKVGVSGESMGGTISTSLSQTQSGIDFQILFYPYLLGNFLKFPSYRRLKDGPIVTEASMASAADRAHRNTLSMMERHFAGVTAKIDPKYSVLLNEKFDHLPATLVIVAEIDPLVDEGLAYIEELKAAGVHSEVHIAEGAPYGFVTVPGAFPEICGLAFHKATEFIRKYGN